MALLLTILASLAIPVFGQHMPKAELRPETTQAFENYVERREAAIQHHRIQGGRFLWADDTSERRTRVQGGEIVIDPIRTHGVIDVKGGIHGTSIELNAPHMFDFFARHSK